VITLAVHGGFLQIFRNEVTLLTDRAGSPPATRRLTNAGSGTAGNDL
jgi:hypothetical protein